MGLKKIFVLLSVLICIVNGNNLTEWTQIRRNRRSLIYETAGVLKFVGGITFPFPLEDPISFRQLLAAYNLQAQYSLPIRANQLYPKWSGRKLENMKIKFIESNSYVNDESRNFVYSIVEAYMDKHGLNGRKCLQKAICENAYFGHFGESEGILAEILNNVLTPNNNNSSKDYIEAFQAGKSGADCISLFPDCKNGESFFDKILSTK